MSGDEDEREPHPRDCTCLGLDGLCPDRLRRAEVKYRRQQVEARQRVLAKRLREGRG